MNYSCPYLDRRWRPFAPCLIGCAWLLSLLEGTAGAASSAVNGLELKSLQRARVSIALIRADQPAGESVTPEIKIRELLFGGPPPAADLARVPLPASRPLSGVPRRVSGRLLIMCWIRGRPCGSDGTVSMGPQLALPLELSGEADDRLSAARSILSVVSMVDRKRRLRNLVRLFRRSSNAHLVLMADAALIKANRHHRFSAARYLRLLSLASGAVGEEEVRGEGLIKELLEFPEITSPAAYRRWRKSSRSVIRVRSWAPFPGFRARVQSLLKISVRSQQASAEQRRWALQALARPPSYIAVRRDPLDLAVMELMEELLGESSPELRQGAVAAMLRMSARVRRRDRPAARRLRRLVQQALERETSPRERRIIQRLIREGGGGAGR